MDDSLSLVASDVEELSGSLTDPALLLPSSLRNARLRADEELIRIMTKAVNELGLKWSPPEEPSRSRLDKWFLPGHHQAPCQRSSPFFPKVHDSSLNRGAPPTRLASVLLPPLPSPPLMSLKRKDMSTCPLWMSLSDGRRGRAIRPSCAEPLLHLLDAPTRQLDKRLRRYILWLCSWSSRPKMLASEEAGLDAASLRDLRSATDLALRATKATAQAIGRSMSSQLVLERHLWITNTEMKEADKVPFLYAPVSSCSLFGPAVEGFAECFMEAQKSSQVM